MKNQMLIPPPVLDVIARIQSSDVRGNERLALLQRLEAIRDACDGAIKRSQQSIFNSNKRGK